MKFVPLGKISGKKCLENEAEKHEKILFRDVKVSIVLLVIKGLNTNHYEKMVQSSHLVFKCDLQCRYPVLHIAKSRGNRFWK